MSESKPLWRRLLDGWLTITGRFGAIHTLSILGFFYVFMIGPFAVVIAAARRDLLDKRGLHSAGSAWQEADTAAPSLERSKLAS